MDSFLLKYLRTGKAFVLIGSGPSNQMGYPSWSQLAKSALEIVRVEAESKYQLNAATAFDRQQYAEVFEIAKAGLGYRRLLDHLLPQLNTNKSSRIYELLARWPIPVYLTTNYDDEIQKALSSQNATSYVTYSNSKDHMSLLSPTLSGAIFKLHGDLRSAEGLILTSSDYMAIHQDEEWSYWRSKLLSIFQSVPMVIIGHSLTDANIRHVLTAAEEASGVHQPVCWIAPDITIGESLEYLEHLRVRVIRYDNKDGSHANLLRLLESIDQFVFARTEIRIREEISQTVESAKEYSAASPGFYVFTRLAAQPNFELLRLEAMCGAILSVVPMLKERGTFSLEEALTLAGWPKGSPIPPAFADGIISTAKKKGVLSEAGALLSLGTSAEELAADAAKLYRHGKTRFKEGLVLRIRRSYSEFSSEQAESLADDIESSLIAFFRNAGLGLATTLLARSQGSGRETMPLSITRFLNEASAQYEDLQRRQAFSTISVEIFAQAEDSDREYLGKISQGFFAFHALGLLGEAASERLKNAKDTVWIVDSSIQIILLALAAPSNSTLRKAFDHMRGIGVRFFSTEKLFRETWEHYFFADKTVDIRGVNSQQIMDAARGQAPYRKTNEFLQGFINWRAAGNPADWAQYNRRAFAKAAPKYEDLKKALKSVGIEVVPLDRWPGYSAEAIKEYVAMREAILNRWKEKLHQSAKEDNEIYADFFEKADPEAEAILIVKKEREGEFYILSAKGIQSSAYFISQTSMLNYIFLEEAITWQPEAFLRFATTLTSASDPEAAKTAFDVLLVSFMQAGLNLMEEETLSKVFGGIIDEASLSLKDISESYKSTIENKYGESPQSVLKRLPASYRPLGAVQLAEEVARGEAAKAEKAKKEAEFEKRRADLAEKKLQKYSAIEQEIAKKRRERKIKSRKKRKKTRKSKQSK